jgi:pimeloyl-ACP methyl ester carboxylesterase
MRAWLICLLLFVSVPVPVLAASDYAREKKWADEITPGIVVGDPVYLEQANKHKFLGIYAEAPGAGMGVIVVHGIGIHPDWGMVGTLRQGLADQGYTTLSIQMPILAVDATGEDYRPTFPEAVERLQLAAKYLKAKGYQKVAVVSHSLGSGMSRVYMATNPPEVAAWASLGLASAATYQGIKAPVLDLYGANDLPQVLSGAKKRLASLQGNPASRQVVIPDTDHFFANHEEAMVKAVKDFLDSVK